jgi:hypothetical protein
MSWEQMAMEPSSGQRNVAKEQYANVRRSLTVFEERVVARYWDEDTPARAGFGRLLGSLDRLAGWLLADDEISRRGQALMRQTEHPAIRGEAEPVGDIPDDQHDQVDTQQTPAEADAGEADVAPNEADVTPGGADVAAGGTDVTANEADVTAGEASVTSAEADVTVGEADVSPGGTDVTVGEADAAVGETGEELSGARRVDVTFTFPADVPADSVVLCGEFTQWTVEGIQLDRGDDGIWRAVVALEPGRSYRYRYLIDGERWENGPGADQYVPNPYGSVDSVVAVEAAAT